jgi:hypothetical protein
MRLTAPKAITFLLAFLVALVAVLIIADIINNPLKQVEVAWIGLLAYAILAVACLIKGL